MCSSGKRCLSGIENVCDAYKYCDDNTNYPYGRLCQNGTQWNSVTRNCDACPQGKYCLAGRVAGDCAPGYICISGAGSPTPHGDPDTDGAYPCPVGYYCTAGATTKQRCDDGFYTSKVGASQKAECTTCPAGYQCIQGTDPVECSQGTYCPTGTPAPIKCPKGRYNPSTGRANKEDCLPCRKGYYCDEEGLGNLYVYGARLKCPNGYYCPTGTRNPLPCPAGTYSNRRNGRPAASISQCG